MANHPKIPSLHQWLCLFLLCSYTFAAAESGPITVLIDAYPQVRVLMPGWDLETPDPANLRLLENGFDVPIQHFGPPETPAPLHVCIVIDHSDQMLAAGSDSIVSLDQSQQDNTPWLYHTQQAIAQLISGLDTSQDTLYLLSTRQGETDAQVIPAGEFDPVMLQPGNLSESRQLYEAWQTGLEALLGHQGRKMLLSFSVGPDQGSATPLATVSGSARLQRVPIQAFVLGPAADQAGEQASSPSFTYRSVPVPSQLAPSLMGWWEEFAASWELAYTSQAPLNTDNRKRQLILRAGTDTLWAARFSLLIAEKSASEVEVIHIQPSDSPPPATETPSLWFVLGAIALSIAAIVWLIRGLIRRRQAGLVEPAIIRLNPNLKRRILKIRVNLPAPSLPAQFQIITQGGKPVHELIFKPGKNRMRARLKELPAGIYSCHLVQGGRKSERVELVWDVEV